MPIPCSAKFTATEALPARAVAASVALVLGDYCPPLTNPLTTISSSGDDPSGDYPASGAINGDRTELNVGPAATAENHIGRASWRSPTIPTVGNPVYLIIDFGMTRIINRLRVYYLTASPLKTYKVQYWTGAAWADITLTDQRYDALGYGLDAYGTSPYGSPSGSGQAIWG